MTRLLTLIAFSIVLLSVVMLRPTTAQEAAGPVEPYVVDVAHFGNYTQSGRVYRALSDGTIDYYLLSLNCEDPGPHLLIGPINRPDAPKLVAMSTGDNYLGKIYRLWDDGSVDLVLASAEGKCNLHSVLEVIPLVGPSPYVACASFDGNFDNVVNTVDLLGLLAAWGDCEAP